MPGYCAYRLDDAGKNVGSTEINAADDREALQIVRAISEELGFEVWCGARLVGRIGRHDKAPLDAPIFSSSAARTGRMNAT